MFIFLKNKKGFSLAELIVSLGIIMMMMIVFMANYKNSNKRTDLVMTAQTMVADIHLAQNNALGLVKYNGTVPGGGWGISFDKTGNSYTLFADLNNPGTAGYLSYSTSTEGNVSYGARVVNLSAGISITSLKLGVTSVDSANVTFLPPDPKTNIYSGGATSTVLEIQLQDKSSASSTKTVRVNFLGLAEVTN